jgi:UPF0755 protein
MKRRPRPAKKEPRRPTFLGLALMAVALSLAACALTLATLRVHAFVKDDSLPERETVVLIPSGATERDIARLLEEKRVISSAFAFDLLGRYKRDDASLQAGAFRFAPHQSMTAILEHLASGDSQFATWVTIPEGYTASEIAETLADASLGRRSDFMKAFFGRTLVLGGKRTRNLEGYLFPDTYLIPRNATPVQIANMMTRRFEQELPPHAETLARRLGFTIPQIVTLASLVEREAGVDDERAIMAGVYDNRLRRGMPLQVDATIEYSFAQHKDTISAADLAEDSPYNTYEHRGLPPTPIANPGRAALLAAFFPRPSNYLYYVSIGNGHSVFARTLAEHNANVARYLK